ncbi:acetate--CoA ligase family protein [Marinobacterium rhizophilum]|uniref:Acetate--CoA ligase family protein n=1 Tax=Marinobacterium rhizophilum TaxID=420402 RepID=A0ABY5HN59_9GAMM|nr:acetate--CoA ligase family protein [Marinobacterium rhizophilum]UTW12336.1 acetate--CoA ligase family protein [Marinobacterium rhizophilum]
MSFFRFLRPRSIAVIGGREAGEAIRQCIKAGYEGEIWPVHPKKDFIEGLKVYRSVQDLPSAPDTAYVAVNRNLTISVIRELNEMGAGGAVCYATGFSESGEEGRQLEAQLLEASGAMPLLGPNCYGMLNYLDKAMLWPDQQGGEAVDSGVAIVTQSSNVAVNFTMQQRGLPLAYVVSLGNKLKFDLHDAIKEFAQQEAVTAIGLYIEGITDPVAFEEAVSFARDLGKPVVAIKSGRSDAAQKMALSHTASLAGSDELMNALFARCGVGRVYSMEGMLEALKVLHVHGPLAGYKLSSLSPSGGDASLLADAVEDRKFVLSSLSEQHQKQVEATVHELVSVSNPFDYQLYDWADQERLTDTFAAFIGAEFDLSLCHFDYPRGDRCDASAWLPAQNALVGAVARTGAKAAVISMLPENMPEQTAKLLISQNIVPLAGLNAGLEGVEAAADIGKAWGQRKVDPLLKPASAFDSEKLLTLNEAESKSLLAQYGLCVPESRIVTNAEEAGIAAKSLSFPVVVKALGVAHKTDVGAVKLNLKSAHDVDKAVTSMAHLSNSFLIEKMVEDVVAEIIVGVVRDEQFGPYLVVGAGGVLVELMRDSRSLLLPVTRVEVIHALQELRSAPLFSGFRGRAEADLDAAADAILSVADFVRENFDTIGELDINPLLVRAKGKGTVAADALISIIK